LFREEIVYSKLNKKALDVMCRSGALDELIDERFSGMKHMWSAAIADRPKSTKKLAENIENYRNEGEFSIEEKILYLSELTGFFPMHLVLKEETRNKLDEMFIPPISEYDLELCEAVWFIPREVIKRKTKNGKDYWILNVIDSNNISTQIRVWGVRDRDKIYINRPYMGTLDYNEQWGFSTRSIYHNWGVRDRDKVYINRPYMGTLDYNEQWGFSTRSIYHNLRLIG